jgi:RecJ-like exonuclease
MTFVFLDCNGIVRNWTTLGEFIGDGRCALCTGTGKQSLFPDDCQRCGGTGRCISCKGTGTVEEREPPLHEPDDD